jgi:hypothetical protein
MALPLSKPGKALQQMALVVLDYDPALLLRVSTHENNEPYFGKLATNRFDDPLMVFGTCYTAATLQAAISETLLHNRTPGRGYFSVPLDEINAKHVHALAGSTLRLANLTGAALKRLGLHAGLSGCDRYKRPQQWAAALHAHKDHVDGLLYMSRHCNTDHAVVLFERAACKVTTLPPVRLVNHPDYLTAYGALGIKVK